MIPWLRCVVCLILDTILVVAILLGTFAIYLGIIWGLSLIFPETTTIVDTKAFGEMCRAVREAIPGRKDEFASICEAALRGGS